MLLYKGFGPIIEDYVDVRNWDLDVILRNVCELNKLVRGIASYGVSRFLPDKKKNLFEKKNLKFHVHHNFEFLTANSCADPLTYLS